MSLHCEVEAAERSRNYTDVLTFLNTGVYRVGGDLQGVGPVACGPAGDPQSGDGVASVDLRLRCKPA